MNVGYYVVAFDHATDTFCEPLGIAWSYVEHRLGMVFILETHATFARELKTTSIWLILRLREYSISPPGKSLAIGYLIGI